MDISSLEIELTKDPKYRDWLIRCYAYAENSKHPSTHNAALIIRGNEIIIEGVNNLPPGTLSKEERFDGENKHIYLNHAERDAIYKAARAGVSTLGLTMAMPWLPCIPCANAIITSGLTVLVTHKQMLERTKERWQTELVNGVQLMSEAGVSLLAYDGLLGVQAFMHGSKWDA